MKNKYYILITELKIYAIEGQKYELASNLRDIQKYFFIDDEPINDFDRNKFFNDIESVLLKIDKNIYYYDDNNKYISLFRSKIREFKINEII